MQAVTSHCSTSEAQTNQASGDIVTSEAMNCSLPMASGWMKKALPMVLASKPPEFVTKAY
jgi:hypothetical protein